MWAITGLFMLEILFSGIIIIIFFNNFMIQICWNYIGIDKIITFFFLFCSVLFCLYFIRESNRIANAHVWYCIKKKYIQSKLISTNKIYYYCKLFLFVRIFPYDEFFLLFTKEKKKHFKPIKYLQHYWWWDAHKSMVYE